MNFLGNYVERDPDGSYLDSIKYRQPTRHTKYDDDDEITLSNSSSSSSSSSYPSVEITDYADDSKRFYTSFGKPPVKKIPDKVYPKGGGVETRGSDQQKKTQSQEYIIGREPVYQKKGKARFKKYYTTLEWFLKGAKVKLNEQVVNIEVSDIINHFGANDAIIRDIVPLWGHSTMVGNTAKITCMEYPLLNRVNSNSNRGTSVKCFASICAGSKQEYNVIQRADVLQIGKKIKKSYQTFMDFIDHTGEYPFRNLVESYDRQLKKKAWVKDMQKHYSSYPKSGKDYIKQLINTSKEIPLKNIKDYGGPKWINDNFTTRMNDPTLSQIRFFKPKKSKYVQFLSGCPFYEGTKELMYFTPPQKHVRLVSLPRHKQVLRLLKVLKKDYGVLPKVPFKLDMVGNEFTNRCHYAELPTTVTLKVCVKVSIA